MITKSPVTNLIATKFKDLSLYLLNSGRSEERALAKTVNETPVLEIKKIVRGSVVTWEGTYQGKPIRVRIYGEPIQEPNFEMNE